MVWCGARKGRVRSSDEVAGSVPATECTLVVSIASSKVRGGRMPGKRFASIDLPVPGGPISKMLCPPAAAISIARLAIA